MIQKYIRQLRIFNNHKERHNINLVSLSNEKITFCESLSRTLNVSTHTYTHHFEI